MATLKDLFDNAPKSIPWFWHSVIALIRVWRVKLIKKWNGIVESSSGKQHRFREICSNGDVLLTPNCITPRTAADSNV